MKAPVKHESGRDTWEGPWDGLEVTPEEPNTSCWLTGQSLETVRAGSPNFDYKKASDLMPHTWILECLELYKIDGTLSASINLDRAVEDNSTVEAKIFRDTCEASVLLTYSSWSCFTGFITCYILKINVRCNWQMRQILSSLGYDKVGSHCSASGNHMCSNSRLTTGPLNASPAPSSALPDFKWFPKNAWKSWKQSSKSIKSLRKGSDSFFFPFVLALPSAQTMVHLCFRRY